MISRPTNRVRVSRTSRLAALVVLSWAVCLTFGVLWAAPEPAPSNPSGTNAAASVAAWGDHVDSPLPEYVTGEECLFCHRDDWGNRWARNFHQRTVRPAEPTSPAMKALGADPETKNFVEGVSNLLGTRREIRFLKRSDQ